jgi:hypothetical protein
VTATKGRKNAYFCFILELWYYGLYSVQWKLKNALFHMKYMHGKYYATKYSIKKATEEIERRM